MGGVSYRLLPHTADLRAALDASSLDELYASAVSLVREILVGLSPVTTSQQCLIPWDVSDPAERFFRFVRELLYLYDAEGFVPGDCRIEGHGIIVGGARFHPDRHESHHQVKALTRHGFVFERRPGGYRAELVFDL